MAIDNRWIRAVRGQKNKLIQEEFMMVEKAENGNLMIEGRIDSTNAAEFEKEVFDLCGDVDCQVKLTHFFI
jgi:hypothetical protein